MAVTNLGHSFRHNMPRQAKNKPSWEIGLQGAVKEAGVGGLSSTSGARHVCGMAVPQLQGNWPADAQAFLPYAWESTSVNPVIQLVNAIYPRVMSGEVTSKSSIDDVKLGPNHACCRSRFTVAGNRRKAFKPDLMDTATRSRPKPMRAPMADILKLLCCTSGT